MADLAQDPLSARKAFDALPSSLSPATPENIANLVKLKQAQIEAQTVLQNTQPGMMMVNPAFDDAQKKAQAARDAFDAAYNGLGRDGQLAVTNYIAANAATEARFQKDLSEMPGVGDIAPGITEQSAPSLFELAKLKDGISQADQAIIEMNMTAQMAGQITDPAAYTAALQAKEAAESKFRETYNTMAANGQLTDIQNYLDSNRLTFIQRVGRNAGLVADGFTDFTKETAAGLVSLPGLAADGANWLTGHRLYDGSASTASHDWAMGGINWLNTHDLFGNEVSGEFVENKTANEQTATNNISTAFTVASVVVSLPKAVETGATLLPKVGTLFETGTSALTTTAKLAEAAPAAKIVTPVVETTAKVEPVVAATAKVAPVAAETDPVAIALAAAREERAAAAAAKPVIANTAAAAEDVLPMAASATKAAANTGKGFLDRVSDVSNWFGSVVAGHWGRTDLALQRMEKLGQTDLLKYFVARNRMLGFSEKALSRIGNEGTELSKSIKTAIKQSADARNSWNPVKATTERVSATKDFAKASMEGSNKLLLGAHIAERTVVQGVKMAWDTVTLPIRPFMMGPASFLKVGINDGRLLSLQNPIKGAFNQGTHYARGLLGATIYASTPDGVKEFVKDDIAKPALNAGFNAATYATNTAVKKMTGMDLDVAQMAKDHPLMAAALGYGALNMVIGSDGIMGKMGMIAGLMMLAWMLESALGPERTAMIAPAVGAAISDGVQGNFSAAGNDLMRIFQPNATGYDAMIGTGRQLAAQQEADWRRQLANPTPALVPTGP